MTPHGARSPSPPTPARAVTGGAGTVSATGLGGSIGEDGALPLPWIEVGLQAALEQRGHALLLEGPRGAGHLELALSLAQTWLCEAMAAQPPQGRACGRCPGCHLASGRLHPDLQVLLPQAVMEELGWTSQSEAPDSLGDGGEGGTRGKPARSSRDIRVADLRAAIDWAHQTPSRGAVKVLVLHPAERLNAVSANALLKTLEEPPASLRLLLTATDPLALLPTVLSRCQRLVLDAPAAPVARQWLSRWVDAAQTDALLTAAGGSAPDALRWARAGWTAEGWLALPAGVRRGLVPAEPSSWPLPLMLQALMALCHDLMAVAVGAGSRHFPAEHLPRGADPRRLARWWQALTAAAQHADHPWNAGLLVESLVLQGRDCWPA